MSKGYANYIKIYPLQEVKHLKSMLEQQASQIAYQSKHFVEQQAIQMAKQRKHFEEQ